MNDLQKQGFLLIEIMGALLLLGALSITIARYQGFTAQWSRQARDNLQAVHVAEDAYDRLAFTNNQQEYIVESFHVERTLKDFVVPIQWAQYGLTAQRLKKNKVIQVKVSWVAMDGKKKTIDFESVGSVGS